MDLLTLGGETHRVDFKGEHYDLPHLKMGELVAWIATLKDVPIEIRAYATAPSELLRLAAAYPDGLLFAALRKVRTRTKLEEVESWGSIVSRSSEGMAYMVKLVHTKEEQSYKKKEAGPVTEDTATGPQKKPSSPTDTAEPRSET